MRHPGRTAVTASALMIGVMLVTAVTVVANGLRQETKGTLNDRIAASHVITAQDGWSPMDPAGRAHRGRRPGRHRASARCARTAASWPATRRSSTASTAPTIGKVFDFEWKDGSKRGPLRRSGADGAVVDDGLGRPSTA